MRDHPKVSESRRLGKKGEHGAALIMVLLIVSILVVVVFESLRMVQVNMAGTAVLESEFAGDYLARSGLNMAKTVLLLDLKEGAGADHLGEPWHDFLIQNEIALPEARESLTGHVEDEQAKFPINALVNDNGRIMEPYRETLFNLLTAAPFALSPEEAETIVLSIKDWLDRDENPAGPEGAESEYYQNLGLEYVPRNGPLPFLGELRLVRGMTDELFMGTDNRPGLKDLLTVYSDGKININTASPLILAALVKQKETAISPEEALEFALRMEQFRNDPFHWDKLDKPDWFIDVPGALSIHFQEFITVKSSHYSVHVTASSGQADKNLFAVLERKAGTGENLTENATIATRYLELQ
ncbi:MAG: type II secretion system minor pseudopilin GspK [Desulfovibrionales bacterium]